MLFKDENKNFMNEEFSDREYAMLDFELIEDEEDYKQEHTERCIDVDARNKINELVRAVKQLNKEVKELENRK